MSSAWHHTRFAHTNSGQSLPIGLCCEYSLAVVMQINCIMTSALNLVRKKSSAWRHTLLAYAQLSTGQQWAISAFWPLLGIFTCTQWVYKLIVLWHLPLSWPAHNNNVILWSLIFFWITVFLNVWLNGQSCFDKNNFLHTTSSAVDTIYLKKIICIVRLVHCFVVVNSVGTELTVEG